MMSETFSRRYRYGDAAKEFKYETAPEKLRIGLWNLIQDYVKDSRLPDYETLYKKITTSFRIARSGGPHFSSEIKQMAMISFRWFEIFDLIEFLFITVQYYDYDESEREWNVFPNRVGEARYQYTKDINNLLSSENLGWRLKKGRLERLGSEFLDKEVVEKVSKLLLNPDFIGPNNQFNKALEFFSKRPKPDLENCVKEAVCALEGLVRILLKDKNITFGDAINHMVGRKIIRKPLDKTFHSLYGFVSSEPGPRHGAHILPTIDLAETEYVLYNAATCMLFLADKFNILSVEEKPAEGLPPEDEVSVFPAKEETPDFPTEEEPPEFPGDDEVPF